MKITSVVPYDLTGEAPVQASSDDQLVELWLGRFRSECTVKYFGHDIGMFRKAVPKPFREILLRDIQAWGQEMETRNAPSSVVRRLTSVRSLFTFAHRIGYLQWNVAAAVTTPHVEDKLAQRIMTEDQVRRLLAALRNPRDNALLRLLYIAGLRISEAAGLRWRHLTQRGQAARCSLTILRQRRPDPRNRDSAGRRRSSWRLRLRLRRPGGPGVPEQRSSRQGAAWPIGPARYLEYRSRRRCGAPTCPARDFVHIGIRHAHATHSLEPRRAGSRRTGDARSCQFGHHHALHARPARRFIREIPAHVIPGFRAGWAFGNSPQRVKLWYR